MSKASFNSSMKLWPFFFWSTSGETMFPILYLYSRKSTLPCTPQRMSHCGQLLANSLWGSPHFNGFTIIYPLSLPFGGLYLSAISNIARTTRSYIPAHGTGESWTTILQIKTKLHLVCGSTSLSNLGTTEFCAHMFKNSMYHLYNTSMLAGFLSMQNCSSCLVFFRYSTA